MTVPASLGRATVGVMGSGRHEYPELAEPLGALIARLELNLLTGAGPGVMTSVSRAYLGARHGPGISIGIVPCAREGYPNAFIELPIHTHLPLSGVDGQSDLSRNHINILSSDIIVALPGGSGTASEVALALRYGKPAIAFATEMSQLANLDSGIARCDSLRDVEAFLLRQLD